VDALVLEELQSRKEKGPEAAAVGTELAEIATLDEREKRL
jgi:hypothetical protein